MTAHPSQGTSGTAGFMPLADVLVRTSRAGAEGPTEARFRLDAALVATLQARAQRLGIEPISLYRAALALTALTAALALSAPPARADFKGGTIALSVDGLNSIDAKTTSAREASKWILGPYESITIDGWQTSSSTARRFFFATEKR